MQLLRQAVQDAALLRRFREGVVLPEAYGFGVDERIVEYPWVLSRLDPSPAVLLDAGSTLNYPYLLDLPQLREKTVVIYTLAPEWQEKRASVSYLYGDLRATLLRDEAFHVIVCVSTLEHIGLDNTKLYTTDPQFKETRPAEYQKVLRELRRLLAPGGKLLLTVPFGRAANLGWMQQFDEAGLDDVCSAFGESPRYRTFFRYSPSGWGLASAHECAACEYFDVHSTADPASDRAAAARAVACLEWVK
jgi:SAM-dependent methyltransferase